MRSLANKETALGLRSGSLASNGETSARACPPRMWVSRRIEEFLSAKRAAAIRTRVADKGFEADRYSCEFAIHTWPRFVEQVELEAPRSVQFPSALPAPIGGHLQALPQATVQWQPGPLC